MPQPTHRTMTAYSSNKCRQPYIISNPSVFANSARTQATSLFQSRLRLLAQHQPFGIVRVRIFLFLLWCNVDECDRKTTIDPGDVARQFAGGRQRLPPPPYPPSSLSVVRKLRLTLSYTSANKRISQSSTKCHTTQSNQHDN